MFRASRVDFDFLLYRLCGFGDRQGCGSLGQARRYQRLSLSTTMIQLILYDCRRRPTIGKDSSRSEELGLVLLL